MQPFSVLISVYSKEHPQYLAEALDSIYQQTAPPDEVILVEDGPLTPELYAVVASCAAEHDNLTIVSLTENKGLAEAMNEGLKHCTHELVARMDSDDISLPHRFEKQLQLLADHPEIDICSSCIDEFSGSRDNIIARRIVPEHHDEIYEYGKRRNPINHPAVMYRKSKVIESGGYKGFPEDLCLWYKMLIDGCRVYNFPESLLLFRWSPELYYRRGGWEYAKKEFRAQLYAHAIGYTSFRQMLSNIMVRSVVSLLPNGLRRRFYLCFLRRR